MVWSRFRNRNDLRKYNISRKVLAISVAAALDTKVNLAHGLAGAHSFINNYFSRSLESVAHSMEHSTQPYQHWALSVLENS